ncbi:T9SS type B sorting domain-containing protein [Portibacter marinus]|uniref:T9SS type B sorting domain-containing protein n=1 Tax=Portibacter marinus TaxID=2898660 RepID=UPI001F48AF60|nr:gliding motility-associated C-terminal domain-containing protein [Portibacter marinus]
MLKTFFICISILFPILIQATDYYWVGGSGNWSDISHWATTSGGNTTHAQAPGSEDNVFFDNNSFSGLNQTVTLNTDIVFCRDMNWTGVSNNPAIVGSASSTLNILGSLALSPNMDFDFQGITRFLGADMNLTVDYAGHSAGLLVIFEGNGGWQFESSVVIDSTLSLRSGTLNTNDQTITSRFLYVEGNGEKSLMLGSSVITLTGKFLDTYRFDDEDIKSLSIHVENVNIDPGTSSIIMTAKDPGFWITGTGNLSLYDVTFSSAAGRALMSNSYFENNINLNELTALSSTTFLTDFDANYLILTGGNVYEFKSGETYELENISGDGDCAQGVIMTSTENGNHTTFSVNSGSVDMAFVTLRDIHASGSASFTASQGVDLGNNNGWSFTNSMSQDFFWINGQGNWTDPGHWSFSSGGPSSGCVPSGKDNVFFDANSFNVAGQKVVIDIPNVYMHDMTWRGITNNGGMEGDLDYRIRITGSLEFDATMEHTFEGHYHFETSEAGNTIQTNGIMFNREMFFSGLTGEWTFLDDVEMVWNLNLLSGTLNTNGKKVTMRAFLSRSMVPRSLNIEESHLILRPVMFYEPSWEVENEGYQLSANGSKIEFESHHGNFGHYGYSETPVQSYDTVLFTTNEAYLSSYNWFLSEDTPALEIDHLLFRGNGYIDGSSHFREMNLAAGHHYLFDANEQRAQRVDELVTSGDCDSGLTQMFSTIRSQRARIFINQNYTLDRMHITDVQFAGATVIADNSLDGGNNLGVTFNEITARTLYWVGDGGFWQDPLHWSLSSGGPGGECVPTSIDDVIFDVNSFSIPNQQVDSYGTRYRNCHNITWTGTTNQPSFVNWFVNPTGDLTYDDSFNNYVWRTVFSGEELQTVSSGGQMFNWIELKHLGEVEFIDDLSLYLFTQTSGSFSFKDINVQTNELYFEHNVPKSASFGNSYITINGEGSFDNPPFSGFSEQVTLDAGNSTVDFTGVNTGFQDYSQLSFNKVIFSNPQATGIMKNRRPWEEDSTQRTNTFRSVEFTCNGETYGNFLTDTLIGAPGKTYIFDADRNMDVDAYLQMIGNNCTPIEMRSSSPGTKAKMVMPSSGEVVVDFVQMRDIQASGGADFNAGARSTDIANSNIGWTFEDAPDFVESGFLGPDRALCTGEDLILDAYSFSPNERYSWNDNSSDSILTVNMPGTYFVEVEFQSSCILRDTVEIFTAQDVQAMLPETSSICQGTALVLDAEVPIATAAYNWNTGESQASIEVSESGIYVINIDVDGCISSDTSLVNVVENPGLDLGGDRSVCEDEMFTLETDIIADAYLWQDGSTEPSITSVLGGLYQLYINYENCSFSDSVMIDITERPLVNIFGPSSVCSNEQAVLLVSNPNNYPVTWQDGSINESIAISESGLYTVTLSDNGCTGEASRLVEVFEAPTLDLGEDLEVCEDSVIVLESSIDGISYLWSNGDITKSIDILATTSSTYTLSVTNDQGCEASDEVNITVFEYPEVDLGPLMQNVCNNEMLILNAGQEGTWQDGSLAESFDVLENGTYSVTVSNNGCNTEALTEITFVEAPMVDLGEDITACEGEEIIVSVPESSMNFQWADGSIIAERIINEAGTYTLIVQENGCTERDSIEVAFNETPVLDLGTDTTVCDDLPYVILPNVRTDGELQWSDGSTANSFTLESSDQIFATLTKGICSTNDSIQVNFKECVYFESFIPNAFSPNQDGINDVMEIYFSEGLIVESFDITVFDRWGNRVFKTEVLEDYWDGRLDGQYLDEGVYMYFVNVSYIDDLGPGTQLIKGDVTLIK